MTSPRLQRILRDVERKKPAEQAPAATDLGAALQDVIEQAVQERVDQALERHEPTNPRLRQLLRQGSSPPPMATDFSQVPAPPKAVPPKDLTALIHRDGEGRAAWIVLGGLKMEVMRNELGRIIGMRQRDESPVLPALDIPFKAAARQYQPGDER